MHQSDLISSVFDEQFYLDRWEDVADAVKAGREKSGLHHFLRAGQDERREISGFDPHYYLRTYPIAAGEIETGHAANPFSHFINFGHARGYLPRPQAPRPDNAAKLENKFGGFWYDQPNALDIIQGKLEIGQIDAEEAGMLRALVTDGYFVLPGAIPSEILEPALADFDKCYAGELPGILLECPEVIKSRAASPWQKEMNSVPSKALDIHHQSAAIRNLIFSDKISRFLGLLFDAPAYATQTLGFLLGSAQEGHQDSAYVAYTIPRQFCATWIALEDVTLGAGELFYYPGSHKFPDFLYAGKYKSVHEAMRLEREEFPSGEVSRHVASLRNRAEELGLKREVFAAKKGDVLFWHADLVHGGAAVSSERTRKSVVTHYCPKYVAPLYVENRTAKIYHHGPHIFSSSYYLHSEPAM
jgi:hypothetical protein